MPNNPIEYGKIRVTYSISLNNSLADDVDALAKKLKVNRSVLIRAILTYFFKEVKTLPAWGDMMDGD